MTESLSHRSLKKVTDSSTYAILCLFAVLFFGLSLSSEVSEYVKDGMRLAVECVIPSSFPFMIISDLYLYLGRPENLRVLGRVFSRMLGLPISGLSAFICGNIGGFPIGAKMVCDIYSSGAISKEDAERLLPLSSNPSCAFVIGGVGLGIYRDARIGALLLASVWVATLLCGFITRENVNYSQITDYKHKQSYNFINSIKGAGVSSVGIISFISLFSVINGLIKKHVKYVPLTYIFSAISEVTNAVKFFSLLPSKMNFAALVLSAFSLGFGGLSVAMQSAVFTSSSDLKMHKYYLIKLLEGLLSSAVFSLLYIIAKRTATL